MKKIPIDHKVKEEYRRRGALPQNLPKFLASKSQAYAALSEWQQATLAGFLFAHDMGQYRHREDKELQILHWPVLRRVFHDKFHEINEQLGWFSLEIQHRPGIARGWAVTEIAEALIEEYAFSDHSERGLIDWLGNPMRRPRSAFATNTTSGAKSRFRGSKLHAYVEIDVDSLLGLVKAGYAWRDSEPSPPGYEYAYAEWHSINENKGRRDALRRIRRSSIQARNLINLAIASSPAAFAIPVVYHEVASGRVHAEGLTPQGCTREVKRASLHGCWEYDMENAHWSFVYQLAARIQPGIDLPHMVEYLQTKPFYRKRVADQASITVSEAKQVLLSLIFGASLQEDPRSAIGSIVSEDKLPALREALKPLYADLKKATGLILRHYETEGRKKYRKCELVNDAGRVYQPKERHQNEKGSKLAHILQGVESEALRACLEVCGDDIALLQHDGFACRNRANRDSLVSAIRERTGITIELSETQL